MRMRDAVAMLPLAEGIQVHRSHWIATRSNPKLHRFKNYTALMVSRVFAFPMALWCLFLNVLGLLCGLGLIKRHLLEDLFYIPKKRMFEWIDVR